MKPFIYFFLTLVFIFACGDDKTTINKPKEKQALVSGIYKGQSTLQYTGRVGEIVLVADNTLITEQVEYLLDSLFGDFIKPYYPPEKRFKIIPMSIERYNKIGKRIRNLIKMEIDTSLIQDEAIVILKKDFYARTQLLTEIKANSYNQLISALLTQMPAFVQEYDNQEWNREFLRHKSDNNSLVRNKLINQFGIALEFPADAKYESVKPNFAKISLPDYSRQLDIQANGGLGDSKSNFIQSGIFIWSFDFIDSSQLNPSFLLKARDTMLKYNALHEIDGVYMGTQDHTAVIPVCEKIRIGNIEGLEFRGLFKFTGRFEPSGGKFWSFHFKHPHQNKIIAISGYLESPPTTSCSFDLRRIQAIIYSLKIS